MSFQPAENFTRVTGLVPLVRCGRPVAHQPTGNGPIAREINSGDGVARSQCKDLRLSAKQKGVVGHRESIDAFLQQLREGCVDVGFDAGKKDFSLAPEGRSRRLRVCGHAIVIGIIPCDEYAKVRGPGNEFMQETDLFWHNFAAHVGEAGYIAAGPVEARYQAKLDRISGRGEYDRNRGGQRFGRERGY